MPSAVPSPGSFRTPARDALFRERLRTSAERLRQIAAQLPDAADQEAGALADEARSIAHTLAGSAGMFGELELGDLAADVELELRRAGAEKGTQGRAIEMLTDALGRRMPGRERNEG